MSSATHRAARRTTARRTTDRRSAARRSTATKIVASVALVAGAASVAGLGTFGAFTSTTSASQDVGSGTVKLGPTASNMNIAAAGLVPGDTVQRSVTLTRETGSQTFGAVKLSTTANTQNILVNDATNGLKMTVEQCPTPWSTSGNALTCSSAPTTVIAARPVLATGIDLAAPLTALNGASATSFLRVTLQLPATAGNEFQGQNNSLTFTFDAQQRGSQAK
ncbi:TasA family protein [Nocardioides sp. zg-DK7169]|uniref:TasA family protein n=1 Tax=Nocardioides sp. zg-DK7169 TaxID=2736600 RepID=UPI0015528733|nr:TasA family protein [Nocardioides sp. zg-DK7169]NPC96632.1 hypothetical protein [Nocardioides sp. zg-DK7169]